MHSLSKTLEPTHCHIGIMQCKQIISQTHEKSGDRKNLKFSNFPDTDVQIFGH